MLADHLAEGAVEGARQDGAPLQGVAALIPAAGQVEDGAERMVTERERPGCPDFLGAREGLPYRGFDFAVVLITIQVIFPQSEVRIERLVGVEPRDADGLPLQLIPDALLPVPE